MRILLSVGTCQNYWKYFMGKIEYDREQQWDEIGFDRPKRVCELL